MKSRISKKLSLHVHFAINTKNIGVLEVILEVVNKQISERIDKVISKSIDKAASELIDEEALEITKEEISEQNPTMELIDDKMVLSMKRRYFSEIFKKAFTTQVPHIVYQRTPLELCIYHYNKCSDYRSESEEDKKVTNDVEEVVHSSLYDDKDFWDYTKDEDFKKAKEFIEIILNSARENGILEDVLIASGIRKELAKELSDSNKEQSNDAIINKLQQNQKAEEKGMSACLVIALASFILAAIFNSLIIAVAVVPISAVIGRSVYTSNQPRTKMLETDANQELGSEITAGS
ncbi:hypothetical protein [Wolbachia endosymbiont of Folsomia candida]|uniref:hypothetical protein n=1 Tax=Wolbachia endosymbiont of Folsomia candida TaxID=169402 RepID=UPI000A8DF20C|nr:hypothetical protein [Wolbachia endosymbiont of Folsomia candida]APR99100.1 hypothetical protein ASM33_07940 [Wolbachia endosymbiont of Folsomia candida]